ncbi:MAG TPA: ATP-binding protein [Mycobacteriales bacterium]|nr:ATP-binding protein [Mycobacteriales bacterium]
MTEPGAKRPRRRETGPWSLRRRLALTVGGTILALMSVGVIVGFTLATLSDAIHRRVDIYGPARIQTEQLINAITNEETGLRGFIITGDESYLQPYNDGIRTETSLLPMLLTNIRQLPGAEPLYDNVLVAIDTWHRQVAAPTVEAVRKNGRAGAGLITDADAKAKFDAIRAAIAPLEDREQALARTAGTNLHNRLRRLAWTLAISEAALIAILVTAMFALRSWVTRPLRRLGSQAVAVAEGERDRRIIPDGPPEIRHLAEDMESMRQQLDSLIQQAETQAHDLQRSNAELEQFAYVASHDLQEPLRKVASFTQLLRKRYGGQLDERADTYIDFAVDGATRMQRLINDLLEFSRVDRQVETVNVLALDDALTDAIGSLSTAIEESQGQIAREPLPRVVGDRSMITQLFQNLVGNALKFHAPGITPFVHVAGRRLPDGMVEVAVSDDGIGIEPEYAEKVFIIFQRLRSREEYPGMGIGLALCRKVVEAHGGRIWVDPREEGRETPGTTVRFTLPGEPLPSTDVGESAKIDTS